MKSLKGNSPLTVLSNQNKGGGKMADIEYCECEHPVPARKVVIEGTELKVPVSGAFPAICARCYRVIMTAMS